MKKLIKLYQEGSKISDILEKLELKGPKTWKALLFAFLTTLVIAVPFVLIISSCYFIYSKVMPFFWILSALTSLLIVIGFGLSAVIYVKLLQIYFPDVEKLKNINYGAYFLKEVLHPFSVVIILVYFAFVVFVL
ncbi:MAG TPA: hypothetical protein PLA20_03165 [Bacilli bacterium]|jgi:hypothetical protein|nr:MAG: hypothetical protein BWX94_00991 [Tenericutes bacterium ADurb.Bin140]HOR95847.1 hypothetical protein [Bacilli bacterium]HPK59218.1 hypothetical protein [Bacilli bacterium]HRS30208.1 hypothetical protein [Bacilli bacterium]HRU48805.1 hypothetical protein [Bacilli bacterium]